MKKLLVLFCTLVMTLLPSFADDYSTFKLDNGQNVIIKEVHDNPIVIIDTWINTGSINETDKNNGAAHFLEHLFFRGTKKYPAKAFDQILESKGAITNAATSKDFTHYYILIPSKYFDLALELHSDMLLNPLIPRKELEKERKVVLEEISKNNDNPSTLLFKNLNGILYQEHPYKREVIGTKEVIETITREEILDFYNTWYTPSNMTTVIIGDIDTVSALEKVKKSFADNKNSQAKQIKHVYKMDKKPPKQTEIQNDFKVDNGYMLIGFKGVNAANKKDAYTLDLLATILGDGKTSRLYRDIKEQKQLAYTIGAGHSSFKDDSVFFISANFAPENVTKLKSAIFQEINKLKQYNIEADEIQKAKNIIERDTYYSRESVSNIANEIGYTMILTGDPKYYANYVENIKKVTAQDLREAAKKYLDINYAGISILLPEKDAVKNEIPVNQVKSAPAKLISQNKNISKYELSNGSALILNKNNTNDIIAIDIEIKGGYFTENIPGLGTVTADALLKGTKKYPNQELMLLLEENGIKLTAQQKADTFSIAMKFTKNETALAQEILKEIVSNAKLDSYDIEKIKTDKLYNIRQKRDNPANIAFEEFKTVMWENTAYGRTGKILERTIPKIQKNDVLNYYNSLFNPLNIVISINGNLEAQEAVNYFTNLFPPKEKASKVQLTSYAKQFLPLTANKIKKVDKDSQTTWIIAGWQTDGVLNKKDWVTLQVIDSLLGSGMSSRLFTQLRDQEGLAYQVGSSFSANMNKGAFGIYIGTNPATALKAKNGLFSEINKLKKEFVSDKELAQAKDKLLGNYILSQETNMDKAYTIGWLEASDRGYGFLDEMPELIDSVTVQDIITTANKYFSKPYVLTVVGSKSSINKI